MCNFNKNKKFFDSIKGYGNNWTPHNARKCLLNGLCNLGYCCIGKYLKNENSYQKTQ